MLAPESFFAGRTVGRGVFVNRWTGSKRRFQVVIDGTWDGRVLALVESYTYEEGTRERKSWRLERTAPGAFTGTYDDVVGTAKVWTEGDAVRLRYKLRLAGIVLDVDETMRADGDDKVIDRARITKWGVPVGHLEVSIHRT